jgi:tetratricopeptide (TPR) repeat protein
MSLSRPLFDLLLCVVGEHRATEAHIISAISSQLCIAGGSSDNFSATFRARLNDLREGSLVVVDHVDAINSSQLEVLIRALNSYSPSAFIAVLSRKKCSWGGIQFKHVTLSKLSNREAKALTLATLLPNVISSETDSGFATSAMDFSSASSTVDESVVENIARQSGGLPGSITLLCNIHMMQGVTLCMDSPVDRPANKCDDSDLVDMPRLSRNISLESDIGVKSIDVCTPRMRECFQCLAPLRISHLTFTKDLAWALCEEAFEHNIDRWQQSMNRLVSVGWIEDTSDQSYIIPRQSPEGVSFDTALDGDAGGRINEREQWDKYYEYWAARFIPIAAGLKSMEFQSALLTFDSCRGHYDLLFTCWTENGDNSPVEARAVRSHPVPTNEATIARMLAGHTGVICYTRMEDDASRVLTTAIYKAIRDEESNKKKIKEGNAGPPSMWGKIVLLWMSLVFYITSMISKWTRREKEIVRPEVDMPLLWATCHMIRDLDGDFDNTMLAADFARTLDLCEAELRITDDKKKREEISCVYAEALAVQSVQMGNKHQYAVALSTIEKAEEVLSPLGSSYEMGKILSRKGLLLLQNEKFDRAIETFEKSVNVLVEACGSSHINVGNSIHNQGVAHSAAGRYDLAIAKYNEFRTFAEPVYGKCHGVIADLISNIANVHKEQKNYEECLLRINEAVDMYTVSLGEDHISTLQAILEKANVLDKLSRVDEALELCNTLLVVLRATVGNTHKLTVTGLIEKATLTRRANGNVKAVIADLEEAIDELNILKTNEGDFSTVKKHDKCIVDLMLEKALCMSGDAEGIELQKVALLMLRNIHDNKPHDDVALSLRLLGASLADLKCYGESYPYFEESTECLTALYGEMSKSVANSITVHADVLADDEKYSQALELYQKQLEIFEHAVDKDNMENAEVWDSIATVKAKMRNWEEAEEAFEKELEICNTSYKGDALKVVHLHINIGSQRFNQSKYSEARESYAIALALEESKTGSVDNGLIGKILGCIGDCYVAQELVDEAKETYQRALVHFQKRDPGGEYETDKQMVENQLAAIAEAAPRSGRWRGVAGFFGYKT